MIFISKHEPGNVWLKAMFKQFCRQNDCTTIWYPNGTAEASSPDATNSLKAEYQFERACADLNLKILDALWNKDNDHKPAARVKMEVTKAYVKELYVQAR